MNIASRVQSLFARSKPADTRPALQQIILPSAMDRWMFAQARDYTPESIQVTIRGAMAGDLQAVWQLYDLMEATWPRLSKNLKELRDAVVSAEWSVQPWTQRGEEPTPEASRRSQALESAIWSMRGNSCLDQSDFRGLMWDLLDAWGKGISVTELLWELRDLPGIGSVAAPSSAVHVWPKYYGYPNDSAELMLNAREISQSKVVGWVRFPENKFLVGVAKQKSGHPAGSSLLRPLAWWWCASNFSAAWLLNFAQIFGLPIRWANYDPSVPGLVDKISDMLDRMGSAGWGAFPSGTTLELKEAAKGSAGSLPQEAVQDRADRNCDILVLGQTLTTDVADSGSRALGDVHEGVLTGRKKAAADWLAGVLNAQFAPAFCRMNWGDTADCPQFVVGSEVEEDPVKMAQRDKILLDAGLELPREWTYQRHNVPIPAEGEPVIERSAASPTAPAVPGEDSEDVQAVHAKDAATEQLVDAVLEDLTGVQSKWLGGVKPWFRELVAAAQSDQVSDAQFLQVLAKARREIPELFDRLDHEAVSGALERAMGAAVVNGAVRGYLQRRRPHR